MSGLRIGSLCTGYGGLDMAVQSVLGGETAWVSDIDKGACKILAHRYPGVPNLGDFTQTDWSTVEPIDVLTAGFPCQPVSHAGKRLGDDDERWLWDDVARAVGELGPRLVVLENVRGLLTAGGGRLFGRVLGTLADLGYDAQWHGLRAADVGAPHGRFRVFVVAYPHGEGRGGLGRLNPVGRDADRRGRADGLRAAGEPTALLPPPVADHSRGLPSSGTDYQSLPNVVCSLLPTPAVNDMGEGKTVEAWDAWTEAMKAKHGNGNEHGASLSIEAQRLLPTPAAADGNDGSVVHAGGNPTLIGATLGYRESDVLRHGGRAAPEWGQYAAAIHRWETLTRPAPPPTELGREKRIGHCYRCRRSEKAHKLTPRACDQFEWRTVPGSPRLSARFSEWMMGLPDGWITDVPGITRNEALKAAGRGVVPQQAAAALRIMLGATEAAA